MPCDSSLATDLFGAHGLEKCDPIPPGGLGQVHGPAVEECATMHEYHALNVLLFGKRRTKHPQALLPCGLGQVHGPAVEEEELAGGVAAHTAAGAGHEAARRVDREAVAQSLSIPHRYAPAHSAVQPHSSRGEKEGERGSQYRPAYRGNTIPLGSRRGTRSCTGHRAGR